MGDMPSIHVPDSGTVMVEYFVPGLTPEILGDDHEGQPAGQAGGRLACGVPSAAD